MGLLRKYKWLRLFMEGLIAVASIVMIVLAAVQLGGGKAEAPTIVFQIIAGIILMIAGIMSAVVSIMRDKESFDIKAAAIAGLLFGLGIFIVLPAAETALGIVILYLVPSVIIGVGAFLFLETVIAWANKAENKNNNIMQIILSIIMIVAGILLLVFADKILPAVWLVLGVVLLLTSVFDIVRIAKK